MLVGSTFGYKLFRLADVARVWVALCGQVDLMTNATRQATVSHLRSRLGDA